MLELLLAMDNYKHNTQNKMTESNKNYTKY